MAEVFKVGLHGKVGVGSIGKVTTLDALSENDLEWELLDTAKIEESVCFCKCGEKYESHYAHVVAGIDHKVYTRKPCPKCGRHDNTWTTRKAGG